MPETLLGEKADVVKLYCILDRCAGRDRRLWPGQAELARRMPCSDRHIRRLLTRLEELGLLREVKRRWNGSTVYVLHKCSPEPAGTPGLESPQRPDRGVQIPLTDRTDESALSGPGSPPNESHERKPKKIATKHTIPEDFAVTEAMRQWAKETVPQVDIDAETPLFIDHHTAKGTVYAKWDKAWQTWMRRVPEFKPKLNGYKPEPTPHVSVPFAQRKADEERARAERQRLLERLVVE